MCTGFISNRKDLIYAYNLDIDPKQWSFDIYKTNNYFTIGIKVGSTTYFTHGVNSNGNFGNLPYMNGKDFVCEKNAKRQRIDLLIDKYICGKLSYDDILEILQTKSIVNIKAASMHSLISDNTGNIVLIEPGYGYKQIKDKYAVISNFPILTKLDNYDNPFYGKDRYDLVSSLLSKSGNDFNYVDALSILNKVKQDGQWGTRVSFVYSRNSNAVYYCLNGDFNNIYEHTLLLK